MFFHRPSTLSYRLPNRDKLVRHLKKSLGNNCLLCEQPSDSPICLACDAELPHIGHACPVCALPLSSHANNCGDCLKQVKPYQASQVAFVYHAGIKHLVHLFKNGQPRALGPWFAQTMLKQADFGDYQPDLLVPVPSHWTSLLRRGYNPAHYLAEQLALQSQIPCANLVRLSHRVRNQKSLSRSQRQRNLHRAFACNADLTGKTLVVVDDIVTTCATAIAISQILLSCGAQNVIVWALARTP